MCHRVDHLHDEGIDEHGQESGEPRVGEDDIRSDQAVDDWSSEHCDEESESPADQVSPRLDVLLAQHDQSHADERQHQRVEEADQGIGVHGAEASREQREQQPDRDSFRRSGFHDDQSFR